MSPGDEIIGWCKKQQSLKGPLTGLLDLFFLTFLCPLPHPCTLHYLYTQINTLSL